MTQTSFYQQLMQASTTIELASQSETVEKLEHFACFSDRLVGLCGNAGSGRSTILKRLEIELPDSIARVYADCQQRDWFKVALKQLGINSTAASTSFQFGLGQLNPESDLLLILDNADALSFEQLEKLRDKVKQENFHCIVSYSSESRLPQWFESESQQAIEVSVPPLSVSEMQLLLEHLQQLGVAPSAVKHLSSEVIDAGNPGRLLAALEPLSQSSEKESSGSNMKTNLVVALAVVFVIMVALVLYFQDDINSAIGQPPAVVAQPKTTDDRNKLSENKPLVKNVNQPEVVTQPPAAESLEPETSAEAEPLAEETIAAGQANADSQKVTEAAEKESTKDENLSANSPLNDDAAKPLSKDPVVPPENGKNDVTKANNAGTSDSQTVVQQESNSKSSPEPQSGVNVSPEPILPQQQTPEKPVPQPTGDATQTGSDSATEVVKETSNTEPQRASVERTQSLAFNAEEQYLLNLNEPFWMVQLGGFSQLENAADFMATNQTVGELHFYRTRRQGRVWHVVVMGPFAAPELAQKAIAQLPQRLRAQSPWAKKGAVIKADIEKLNDQ
ncbi:MAG: SPOR domain-containing protein [Gammaproteobacteria bacterium]|nr:SPOR domain-containing protein [Gammaproteobacteria bacterium]